jgi:hypothetical protein
MYPYQPGFMFPIPPNNMTNMQPPGLKYGGSQLFQPNREPKLFREEFSQIWTVAWLRYLYLTSTMQHSIFSYIEVYLTVWNGNFLMMSEI